MQAGNADAYGDDGDPNAEYMYGGGYDEQMPKWFEHGSVTDSRINNIQSITCVAFDPFEEVLWTGLQTGRTVSYLMPTMEKYTAFSIYTLFLITHYIAHTLCCFSSTLTTLAFSMLVARFV